MTDISVRSESWQTDDMSWLGSSHGTSSTETGTLDVSAFTAGTHYPNGYFLAGIPLAQLANTLYVPYAASPSEVQRITVDATGGTYTISFDGATTAAISATATAAAVQTALELLSTVNSGDITVTGGPGNAGGTTPYTLTFGGRYVGLDVPAVTTATSLTGGAGTAAVTTITAGGGSGTGGSQTLVGHLYRGVRVPNTANTAIDVGCAVLVHGKVRLAKLLAATGLTVDAAGQADVAGRIRYLP